MRTNQALIFSGITLVVMAGLALSQDKSPPQNTRPKLSTPHEAQPPTPGKSVKAAADYPVICYLEQRGRTITVKAGPKITWGGQVREESLHLSPNEYQQEQN